MKLYIKERKGTSLRHVSAKSQVREGREILVGWSPIKNQISPPNRFKFL